MSTTDWDSLSTYWAAQISTAYTAGNIEEPDRYEADALLDRWIDAEKAADVTAATDITSYSVAGRSVARRRGDEMRRLAADARQAFMTKLYGNVTYADMRSNEDAIDEI